MTEVSRRIADSAHVDIYGVGGSAMLAEELQGRLYRIGIRAYAWAEVHIGLTSAAIQDAGTVAIGISTTGRTEEIIQMLAEAGRAGALTVTITNNPASPLAELADRTIVTSVYEQFLQARRPVGQARPAPGPRPALPAGRPAELRPVERQARRLGPGRLLAPAAAPAAAASGSDIMTTVPSTFRTLVADFAGRCGPGWTRSPRCAADGGLDEAIDLLTEAIEAGAVIHAFGTGHSEAFAMEIAGRAGGLIPTNKIALRDLVLRGDSTLDALGGSSLERNPTVAEDLWDVSPIHPGDVFVIASNSGVNGSIVGFALLAKEHGHPVIAVTSLEHTMAVPPKHPSGQRLCDVADVVLDNLAPYGDATLALGLDRLRRHVVPVGSVSSITSAFIAQLLTIGVAERIAATGDVPPLYLSANIPGGDEHNSGSNEVRGPDPARHLSVRTRPHRTTQPTKHHVTPGNREAQPHEHQRPSRSQRRDFLRGSLGLAALTRPAASWPRAPPSGTGDDPGGQRLVRPGRPVSDTNPFGMAANSTVDAVIFNGGYGIAYTEFAAKQVEKLQTGSTVKVTPATNIAQTLQPRFVAGNPPDVIDNSGAGLIGINTIRDQLEDLTAVIEAKNYEGMVIKDTLYAGVTEPGTFDGKFVQLNYVLTVYALWYSASLFKEKGWTVPKTYDEMLALGAEAKGKGKFLLGWGKEAATLLPDDGHRLGDQAGRRRGPAGAGEPQAGLLVAEPVQAVFTGLKKIIDAGYVKPGGAGTQFTAAQSQWSNAQDFILYPSRRLDRERDEEADQGRLRDDRGAGAGRVQRLDAALGGPALHRRRGLHRPVAGQERRRRQGVHAGHAVQGGGDRTSPRPPSPRPSSRTPSPRTASARPRWCPRSSCSRAPATNVFTWNFIDLYGLNTDKLVLWNTFLQGGSDVATLTKGLQAHHRQDRERRLHQEGRGQVTWSSRDGCHHRQRQHPGRETDRGEGAGVAELAPAQPDLRPDQLLHRVPDGPGGGLPDLRGVALRAGRVLLPDQLDRASPRRWRSSASTTT